MTVSIAVTNRPSTLTPKNVPRIAKIPRTTITSWSSATSAVTPNFTSRKRSVIQIRMPNEPMRMRTTASWIRSELTTAPIELSFACSAIGPNWATSARAMSPSSPVVGTSAADPGMGAADGLGTGVVLGAGDGVGAALGAGVGSADGPGDAPDAAGAADGEGPAVAAPLASALPLGAAVPVGTGVGVGSSRRSRPVRRMSKKPRPVRVTVTSSWPIPARAVRTSSAATFGFSNRIDHSVPPV